MDATKVIMDFFKEQHCVLQKRNYQQCSPADRFRPAVVLIAFALALFFLLLSTTPTY